VHGDQIPSADARNRSSWVFKTDGSEPVTAAARIVVKRSSDGPGRFFLVLMSPGPQPLRRGHAVERETGRAGDIGQPCYCSSERFTTTTDTGGDHGDAERTLYKWLWFIELINSSEEEG
jgi:hypothetical protein